MESLHVIFDARWGHERTGQHRTTSKYHSWAFDVGCWMFTWALNVECRMLNVDEHSTLNIQRSTPKAPLHPGSGKGQCTLHKTLAGNSTTARVPAPGALWMVNAPWYRSTRRLTMARPSPAPCCS